MNERGSDPRGTNDVPSLDVGDDAALETKKRNLRFAMRILAEAIARWSR